MLLVFTIGAYDDGLPMMLSVIFTRLCGAPLRTTTLNERFGGTGTTFTCRLESGPRPPGALLMPTESVDAWPSVRAATGVAPRTATLTTKTNTAIAASTREFQPVLISTPSFGYSPSSGVVAEEATIRAR
jgi:hypothetical protein